VSTSDTQIATTAKSEIDWVRHHLIVVVAAIILSIGSIYAIETLLANRAHDQWQQALGLLNQMQKQNEQTQAGNKLQIEAANKQIDALTQSNAVLQQQFSAVMQSIASRDAQLFKDRGEIKTLPPTALATKWGASANEPAPVISANGDFDVPLPLAQKSYDALIQVPVFTKDNVDLKTAITQKTQEAANSEQKFTTAQSKFEGEQKAHQSDNETCKQTIATKDAEIKSVKADARKRNIIVSVFSLAVGFLLHH